MEVNRKPILLQSYKEPIWKVSNECWKVTNGQWCLGTGHRLFICV